MGATPPLAVQRWALFDGHAVDALVTTRQGGTSTGPHSSLNLGLHVGDDPGCVVENRRRAAAALGLELADLVFCTQSHGRGVAVVDRTHRGRGTTSVADALPGADALVTATPHVGLVTMVADCVPLVLYEPAAQVLACVHAGWRGTVARAVDAAIQSMATLGGRPNRILAGIGPALADYQVGSEVAAAARHCFGSQVDELVQPDGTGRWRFNLKAANRRVLLDAGVPAANIDVSRAATGEGSPLFSDRAARPCGRFAALAALRPTSNDGAAASAWTKGRGPTREGTRGKAEA